MSSEKVEMSTVLDVDFGDANLFPPPPSPEAKSEEPPVHVYTTITLEEGTEKEAAKGTEPTDAVKQPVEDPPTTPDAQLSEEIKKEEAQGEPGEKEAMADSSDAKESVRELSAGSSQGHPSDHAGESPRSSKKLAKTSICTLGNCCPVIPPLIIIVAAAIFILLTMQIGSGMKEGKTALEFLTKKVIFIESSVSGLGPSQQQLSDRYKSLADKVASLEENINSVHNVTLETKSLKSLEDKVASLEENINSVNNVTLETKSLIQSWKQEMNETINDLPGKIRNQSMKVMTTVPMTTTTKRPAPMPMMPGRSGGD